MSIQTRKEILLSMKEGYKKSTPKEKRKIIDDFISIAGHCRKYAIYLLNKEDKHITNVKQKKRARKKKYDKETLEALLTLWHAANQICSKRLVPFIPDLLEALERFGHISLPTDVRKRLLEVSPSTVDRLLEPKKKEINKGVSTTRSGSLLKKQIKVRTFADWDDVIPGFLEGDLVAHCGNTVAGSFLNSLVLTDIASGWTEFFPLLKKGEADVIAALKVAQQMLPFILAGLDTDNGSEFINYALLEFCTVENITFTRSRAYKKNDQAHVEEKNGSIVRRLIGYDRYEGLAAYNALSELYATLRLYVNFFQPSLKLIYKKRDGAKVTKKYDKAKTPYQRLLCSSHLSQEEKDSLKRQYKILDPIALLKELEKLQNNFWKHAWQSPVMTSVDNKLDEKNHSKNIHHETKNSLYKPDNKSQLNIRRYRSTKKPRKALGVRTWLTRPDNFKDAWGKISTLLEATPQRSAKSFLEELIKENPEQFNMKQLRTIQRRIAQWRKEQLNINHKKTMKNISTENKVINQYISLTAHSAMRG